MDFKKFSFIFYVGLAAQCFSTSILVTGGAGYIGSYVAKRLKSSGCEVIVLDNLATGDRRAAKYGTFVQGSISDRSLLDTLFSTHSIDAVMHFAASTQVGESINDPLKYHMNNVAGTLILLDAMHRHHVDNFIFSSSCAVYGDRSSEKILESSPKQPSSPYGVSKLMIETVLEDLDKAKQMRHITLRYFNAAGADPDGEIPNYKENDILLIPTLLKKARSPSKTLEIYGTDYPTADGTCIRDYVHIDDLADAHIMAMNRLISGAPSAEYNLGCQKGYSVLEVIASVEKALGEKINVIKSSRRKGDLVAAVADSSKAMQELGWSPKYSLNDMIRHANQALR